MLADPDGDLPKARLEARRVATWLHTTAAVGSDATSQQLFVAAQDGTLHLATHAGQAQPSAMLALADRKVSALEISSWMAPPSFVVLAACASGVVQGLDEGSSLAAAFLMAGSRQVVATLRPISDRGALELSTGFYGAGGFEDAARALAKAQTLLSKTTNTDWPQYSVFGDDVCIADSSHP